MDGMKLKIDQLLSAGMYAGEQNVDESIMERLE